MSSISLDALRSFAFFSALKPADFAELSQRCIVRDYGARDLIIGHTDQTFDVLFLLRGVVRISIYSVDGQKVSFRDMKAGAIFGELSAIDGRPRSASVECAEPCVVAVMRQQHFLSAIATHPDFTMAVLRHMTGYVRVLTERVFEFSTMAVNKRLHAELLRMAEQAAGGAPQVVLSPAPTHAEFASRISTHREAVSREFSLLETRGLVIKEGRKMKIPSLANLRALIEAEQNQ